jgi:uncharacterized protein (TIGR02996 family)
MSTRAPDYLLFRGSRRLLVNFPLEPYLRELPAKPDFRIDDRGNKRGYVATWEVRDDDTLWFVELQSRGSNGGPDPGIRLVFPHANGPIAATWVSMRLQSPDGQPRFSPIGYATMSASVMYLTVSKGRVILVDERHGETERRIRAEFTQQLDQLFGTEEAAFIRAAHETPDDSAPRLIYADWLDEHGDRRGDVIRHAERLRHLDPSVREHEIMAHRRVMKTIYAPLWFQLMGYEDVASGWE